MLLVDTNILLHAINGDAIHHRACCVALEGLVNGRETWALSWGVAYEFCRVATHPRVFPKPLTIGKAYSFVSNLMSAPTCVVLAETSAHGAVLDDCMAGVQRLAGNLLHDFHIAVLMREHGVGDILTYDTDFRAFPWIKVHVPA